MTSPVGAPPLTLVPEGTLTVLSAADPTQRQAWLGLWARWPEREPAAHPGFLEALAGEDESPRCAVLVEEGATVLFPFLVRPVRVLPGCGDTGASDITGPFWGYTGAFFWGTGSCPASRFWGAFGRWAEGHAVVSAFTRLSLFGDQVLPPAGQVRIVRPNVVRHLSLSDEELWADVEHKVRKNVKRARAEGVTVKVEAGAEGLDAFVDVYRETMQRRHAAPEYHMGADLFERLLEGLGDQVALFIARAGGEAVSVEMVVSSSHHAYSFLGGTRAAAFPLRPNDLLKFEIIRWARDRGMTEYVLGGGPQPDDGIFRYKRSFAPKGVVPFLVDEHVFDPSAYRELVDHRRAAAKAAGERWAPRPGFFPAYRS